MHERYQLYQVCWDKSGLEICSLLRILELPSITVNPFERAERCSDHVEITIIQMDVLSGGKTPQESKTHLPDSWLLISVNSFTFFGIAPGWIFILLSKKSREIQATKVGWLGRYLWWWFGELLGVPWVESYTGVVFLHGGGGMLGCDLHLFFV